MTIKYVKPTDAAMILPFNSCHPRHCPRSIPYSQCLRLRRICSEDSVFEKRCQELKVKLQRRGYPGSLIDAAMRKVSDQPRASTLQYSRRNQQSKADRVPFIVRHNPKVTKQRRRSALKEKRKEDDSSSSAEKPSDDPDTPTTFVRDGS
ncbi:hypothetical protein ACOMHN_038613 [Nucella lapillus]